MSGLSDMISAFEAACDQEFPTDFQRFPTAKPAQDTERIDISHVSQFPTEKQDVYEGYLCLEKANSENIRAEEIASIVSGLEVGNVGNVGNEGKSLAQSTTSSFPLIEEELGNVGNGQRLPAGAFSGLDLNRAAPQRSAWRGNPLLEEIDAENAARAAPAPLIPPAKVRAGVERELRALAARGCTGPEAHRDAAAITRALVRNSPALYVPQADPYRCHVCGDRETPDRPLVPVINAETMTGPDRHHWLHRACHDEHIRCQLEAVEAVMAAAGFGEASA